MNAVEELSFFLENGYLVVPGLMAGAHLRSLQEAFDHVWETEPKPVSQSRLLRHRPFIELVEHPPILQRLGGWFNSQLQLLQADIALQPPHHRGSERGWHRDFVFPGERPVAVNTIIYLDRIGDEQGPTRVVPGSHRGEMLPAPEQSNEPLPGEVPVYAEPGDAVFINAAIWHSAGVNHSDGLRRTIYYYYGYWWLKRFDGFEGGKHDVPWQAMEGASEQRLELLGLKMPPGSMHSYEV